jgi:glycosyltransferase involved in cell wall biosynthesis
MKSNEFEAEMVQKKRRVLMLLENCPFPRDDRVRREARALTSAGYQVTVVAPASGSEPKREVWEGVTVIRYPPPQEKVGFLGYIWEYAYSLTRIFLISFSVFVREGFDIVHAHHPPDMFALIAGFYKLFGKKYVMDHHDLAPDLYEARFRGRARGVVTQALTVFERLAFRLADRVIATNESYKRVEMERGQVDESRIVIVRNGPDLNELYCDAADPSLRKNGRTLIGYVGVMGTQDGVENLLYAMKHLVFDLGRRDVLCVLVGSGNALPELSELANTLGIGEYARFTGWVNGQDEVRRYLNSMDICAAPEPADVYNHRSTAAKVMEYMAVGKPVVSFDLTEHRFTAGPAALYAAPNDCADFARKLEHLIAYPQQREELGRLGLTRIREKLAWQRQEHLLVEMYGSLWGGSAP